MKDEKPTYEALEARLAQAEEMIAALRDGQVDAILGEDSVYMLRLKEVEEASERNRALFQNTFENAAVGLALVALDGRLKRVNLKLSEIVGYERDNLRGMRYQDFTHPEDLDRERALTRRLIRGEIDSFHLEKRYVRKDGIVVWVRLTASMLNKKLIVGVVEDITDRKQAEEALRESQTRLRRLYESGMIGVLSFDLDGPVTDANDKFLEMVGYTREDLLLGRVRWDRMTPHEYRALDEQGIAELKARGVDTPYEKEFIRKDGSRVPVVIGAATTDEARHVGIAFVLDISERKRAEKALREAHDQLGVRVQQRTAELEAESERRRYLAKRLVEVLEEDRRSLSMLLHDDIGQILAGAKMQIENLENELTRIDPQVPAKIDPILESLQGIMSSLRNRSRQLRPSSLDTLGLASALRSIGKGDSKCRIRYHVPEEPQGVDSDLKLTVFRIAQEAVTNALKHADCNEIDLSLVRRYEVLTLMIEDNGRGFSYDEMASGKDGQGPMGLLIMRERAVNAGGDFRVESAPGKGATVIAEFPLEIGPRFGEGTG